MTAPVSSRKLGNFGMYFVNALLFAALPAVVLIHGL
jgi:hypothetical protein